MWTGIGAGLVEFVPDIATKAFDNFELLAAIFEWDESTKKIIQGILIFIVMPIARAWKQKKVERAAIAQATRNDLVVPKQKSGVTVRGELM